METFANKNKSSSTTFTTNAGYDVRGLPLISGVSAGTNVVGVYGGLNFGGNSAIYSGATGVNAYVKKTGTPDSAAGGFNQFLD